MDGARVIHQALSMQALQAQGHSLMYLGILEMEKPGNAERNGDPGAETGQNG
jgi:hypothetical protein